MIDVVVLLGAPGSGKTTIGEALARRGLRWREWETVIVERWGTRERFIAEKTQALPVLHDEIRAWIARPGPPAVLETTGLSDAPLLADLAATTTALVVRLDVSEPEALRRIADRARGRHLTDDVEPNRKVWRAFHEHVVDRVAADRVIDTEAETVDAVVDAVLDAAGLGRAGSCHTPSA